jgi:hypothetical protein
VAQVSSPVQAQAKACGYIFSGSMSGSGEIFADTVIYNGLSCNKP